MCTPKILSIDIEQRPSVFWRQEFIDFNHTGVLSCQLMRMTRPIGDHLMQRETIKKEKLNTENMRFI